MSSVLIVLITIICFLLFIVSITLLIKALIKLTEKKLFEETKEEQKEKIIEKLQNTIENISEKIELFEEVKEHIIHGGAAREIVWDYSKYMTLDGTTQLIDELKTLEIYLKEIYSEFILEQNLSAIDNELKDIFIIEFTDLNKKNLKDLDKYLDKLITKFNLDK